MFSLFGASGNDTELGLFQVFVARIKERERRIRVSMNLTGYVARAP